MEMAVVGYCPVSPCLFYKPGSRVVGVVSSVCGGGGGGRWGPVRRQGSVVRVEEKQRSVGGGEEAKLGCGQLLQFEREGHVCVRGLFGAEEMGALGVAVSSAADRERLSAYRHRVAVLCPGVDPFSLHSIAEAEAVIRQQVACCCISCSHSQFHKRR
jgi:hypothetical protein